MKTKNDRVDKAAQFKAFDALKGFREELENARGVDIDKPILFDDRLEELQNALNELQSGSEVLIKYYQNKRIKIIEGIISSIDYIYKQIVINTTKINIKDIIELTSK